MVRKVHGAAPKPKKAAKKTAKPRSILDRASAKKRGKKAAATRKPTTVAPSKDRRRSAKVVVEKPGEHPVDTLARARDKERRTGASNPASNIDDERSQFRRGPLDEVVLDDVCRMLRTGIHRVIAERLLGLSKGRIAKWIAHGKASREAIETWHDAHDELVQGRARPSAFKKLGKQPELDIFALFHCCVLEAEATGEQTCVACIVNAAVGRYSIVTKSGEVVEAGPDWRANAWLLSRRYGKRWGSHVERVATEEEDLGDSKVGQQSAVDRLAGVLNEMFGKEAPGSE